VTCAARRRPPRALLRKRWKGAFPPPRAAAPNEPSRPLGRRGARRRRRPGRSDRAEEPGALGRPHEGGRDPLHPRRRPPPAPAAARRGGGGPPPTARPAEAAALHDAIMQVEVKGQRPRAVLV